MTQVKTSPISSSLSSSSSSSTPVAHGHQDIIKLQLKKPISWNWQLSTSKSSPHIALPIIQLFDAKGQLLLEARDSNQQRSTWHSSSASSVKDLNKNKKTTTTRVQRHLQRCRSDTLSRISESSSIDNHHHDRLTSTIPSVVNDRHHHQLSLSKSCSSAAVLNNARRKDIVTNQSRISRNRSKRQDVDVVQDCGLVDKLKKSRSAAVLGGNLLCYVVTLYKTNYLFRVEI